MSALENEALWADPDFEPVIDLLTQKGADPQKQLAVTRALEDMGISETTSATELARKKPAIIQRLRAVVGELFAEEAQPMPEPEGPAAEVINLPKARPGVITAENVDQLLAKHAGHPVITLVQKLKTPKQRLRALTKAGIKIEDQLDPLNEGQMEVLQDKVAEVVTGQSMMRGRRGLEIFTPTGSGRNR